MDDLRIFIILKIISVIRGQWDDDTESLCAMEPCLRLKSGRRPAGIEPGPLAS